MMANCVRERCSVYLIGKLGRPCVIAANSTQISVIRHAQSCCCKSYQGRIDQEERGGVYQFTGAKYTHLFEHCWLTKREKSEVQSRSNDG